VKQGRKRDELYWSQNEWCPCGKTCKERGGPCDHSFYAHEYDIPIALPYAERAFFIALEPVKRAAAWPVKFARALPVGADDKRLNKAWRKFALTMLRHRKYGMLKCAYTHAQENAILNVIKLFVAGDFENLSVWQEASLAAMEASRAEVAQTYGTKESAKLRAQAGNKAAHVAANLAAAVADERQIADAIPEAPSALRDFWFADVMVANEKNGSTYSSSEQDKQAAGWQQGACAWYSRQLLKNLHGGPVRHAFKAVRDLLP